MSDFQSRSSLIGRTYEDQVSAWLVANGYTISVQWGVGNYCSNRLAEPVGVDCESATAEVAVWDAAGVFLKLGEYDDVIGWQTPDDVSRLIAETAAR